MPPTKRESNVELKEFLEELKTFGISQKAQKNIKKALKKIRSYKFGTSRDIKNVILHLVVYSNKVADETKEALLSGLIKENARKQTINKIIKERYKKTPQSIQKKLWGEPKVEDIFFDKENEKKETKTLQIIPDVDLWQLSKEGGLKEKFNNWYLKNLYNPENIINEETTINEIEGIHEDIMLKQFYKRKEEVSDAKSQWLWKMVQYRNKKNQKMLEKLYAPLSSEEISFNIMANVLGMEAPAVWLIDKIKAISPKELLTTDRKGLGLEDDFGFLPVVETLFWRIPESIRKKIFGKEDYKELMESLMSKDVEDKNNIFLAIRKKINDFLGNIDQRLNGEEVTNKFIYDLGGSLASFLHYLGYETKTWTSTEDTAHFKHWYKETISTSISAEGELLWTIMEWYFQKLEPAMKKLEEKKEKIKKIQSILGVLEKENENSHQNQLLEAIMGVIDTKYIENLSVKRVGELVDVVVKKIDEIDTEAIQKAVNDIKSFKSGETNEEQEEYAKKYKAYIYKKIMRMCQTKIKL